MIKLDETNILNLAELLDEHWNHLNPKAADNDFARHSLIKKIERAKENVDNGPENIQFLEFLLSDDYQKLREIILSKPDKIQELIDEINQAYGADMFSNNVDDNTATLTPFGDRLLNIFDYTSYRGRQQCKDNIASLSIEYCAYCNKDEIEVVGENQEDGDLRLYGMIDHYYAKSRHPYLALSFYNLIPSCYKCNSQLKRNKDFRCNTHINLFDKSFDEYFQFSFNNILADDCHDVEISIINKIEYPDYQLSAFDLLRRYNTGAIKRVVFNGIRFYNGYTEQILRNISNQLNGLAIKIDDVHLLYCLPTDPNQINKYSLGKLKRDICKQLNVLAE